MREGRPSTLVRCVRPNPSTVFATASTEAKCDARASADAASGLAHAFPSESVTPEPSDAAVVHVHVAA